MILDSTEKYRKYIAITKDFDISTLSPKLRQSKRDFIVPFIGKVQLKSLEDLAIDDQTGPVMQEAQELLEEALANFTWYLYLPQASIQFSDAGLKVNESEHSRSLNDKENKELQRSLKTSGHKALDQLLKHMHQNIDEFTQWKESDYYKDYSRLLITSAEEFSKHFNIFSSAQTFHALRPNMQEVEDQYLTPTLGEDTLQELKEQKTPTETQSKVIELLKKSLVAYTIVKTMDTGLFILDPGGIHLKFDLLPYEKAMTNVNLKINDFIVRTSKAKTIAGDNYLKKAVMLIEESLNEFPTFIPSGSDQEISFHSTKSISMI